MSTPLTYPNPANTAQYATDLDEELGASFPIAPPTLEVTSAWVQSESPSFPGWNGLGTELDLPGATKDPSNPAVYDYPTLEEGLTAAVDMIEGNAPQTKALDPAFAKDVASGKASTTQLVSDIRSGDWDGSPDSYDANAIVAKLQASGFSVAGSPADTSTDSASTTPNATTTGFDWNPLSWPGQVVGSATSSLAGDIGTYILKGVLTLVGGSMIVYGATLLANKGGGSKQSNPSIGSLIGSTADVAPEAAALA